jgi:hypothetical protein
VWIEHSCKLLQNHLAKGIPPVHHFKKIYSTVGGVDLPPGNYKKIIQHKVGINTYFASHGQTSKQQVWINCIMEAKLNQFALTVPL